MASAGESTTRPEVPLFATGPALAPLLGEVIERQRSVIDGGRYILGPEVEAFEAEFASALGGAYCVGVGNGTDALTIALRALGVGSGDEVVLPTLTFYATAEAVVNAGATPVFCDVDPDTYCMTAETAAPHIGPRTAALLPVHLYGNPAPMGELQKLADRDDLVLLEDAAQAAGARLNGRHAGFLGDAGTFSFFPSKNLGGFGDGGAIVTDDEALAERARRLRFHGSADKKVHTEIGFNSRLDEIQAAGLRVLLPHLPEWTAARRGAAAAYGELGLGEHLTLPVETEGAESCFHLYMARVGEDRDQLAEQLGAAGVGARAYYTIPMHRQPALEPYAAGPLPAADAAAAECLALPMGPALDRSDVEAVVAAVAAAG